MDERPPRKEEQEERRGRRVLLLTSVASVLVMGGLVALAVGGQAGASSHEAEPTPPRHESLTRQFQWPAGCTPDKERPPHLVVDLKPEGLDFGQVKQGGTIEKTVGFRNEGVGPLCLQDPQTGCGCIKVMLKDDRTRYEPGESGAFVVRLVTEGYQGPQQKSFSVMTNEYESPRRTWSVRADISLGVLAVPSVLSFGQARRGMPATALVRLTSPKADPPWQIVGVTGVKAPGAEPPAYTWEAKPLQDPTLQGYELSVKHPGSTQDGLFSGHVIVRTTHPERAEVMLNVTLVVAAPLTARPPAVMMGYVQNGAVAQPTNVLLQPISNLAFQVLGLRVEPATGGDPGPDGPGFTAELKKDKSGAPFVEVRYDGKSRKAGLIEAVLVISTDVADQKELRVPLKATVAAAKAH
jgi:hypothetical protein